MTDPYHHIYQGEIFQQSQCIWHENTLMDFFRCQLTALGYEPITVDSKVWRRQNRTVVVCLVDDFSTCRQTFDTEFPYIFDRDTVVITDNFVTVPTVYKVCQLPHSFFGIYSHRPKLTKWLPNRRFNFSVNRIDQKRLLLMLEIWNRCMLTNADVNTDFVNFNCWSWTGCNTSQQDLRQNFQKEFENLADNLKEVYNHVFEDLVHRMPWRNHDLDHEHSHMSAWCNLVVETYSSDANIAVSEKLFRAMCLPVPWMVYAGRYTVAWLASLGFDTLQDVCAHGSDGMIELKTAEYGDKMVVWVFDCSDTVDVMKQQDHCKLQDRLRRAADHNQALLQNFQRKWSTDFAAWWPNIVLEIQ